MYNFCYIRFLLYTIFEQASIRFWDMVPILDFISLNDLYRPGHPTSSLVSLFVVFVFEFFAIRWISFLLLTFSLFYLDFIYITFARLPDFNYLRLTLWPALDKRTTITCLFVTCASFLDFGLQSIPTELIDNLSKMSITKCVYHNCNNVSRDISMFRFPVHDQARLILWIQNSGSYLL